MKKGTIPIQELRPIVEDCYRETTGTVLPAYK
ncbi:hypothetical protein QE429_000684 [Bacillus sp. SORGH_AS 510]|nr:hypothetical protein [Bacillus sp. SORGH_AS_0510]